MLPEPLQTTPVWAEPHDERLALFHRAVTPTFAKATVTVAALALGLPGTGAKIRTSVPLQGKSMLVGNSVGRLYSLNSTVTAVAEPGTLAAMDRARDPVSPELVAITAGEVTASV